MNFRKFAALPVLAGALVATAHAAASERNFWPFVVEQRRENHGKGDGPHSAEALGAVGFYRSGDEQSLSEGGIRPLYLERKAGNGKLVEAHLLYPLLTYRVGPEGHRWSFLNLVNRVVANPAGPPDQTSEEALDIWPVYFSRHSQKPGASYRAVFPLAGSVPSRFGQDRVSWWLFPLYGRFEKRGATTLTAPWPVIKILQGDGHSGFEFWPLYGDRHKPGAYSERFALWPLVYDHQTWSENGQRTRKVGFLPFYARDEQVGYRAETFAWPFFGYVNRSTPYRYQARHYLWPLWVQGAGDDRRVNRWAPFYAHSIVKGTEKSWVLWPLWRASSWTEGNIAHRRTQLLYFVYNSNTQRRPDRPSAEAARKIHLWPFLSLWENGAGRKQWQAPSPFEVFFPHNEQVRLNWTPLTALYRLDQSKPGVTRHSALWNAISYRKDIERGEREFHLGPLFSTHRSAGGTRIALLGGIIAWKHGPSGGWRMALGAFGPELSKVATSRGAIQ